MTRLACLQKLTKETTKVPSSQNQKYMQEDSEASRLITKSCTPENRVEYYIANFLSLFAQDTGKLCASADVIQTWPQTGENVREIK